VTFALVLVTKLRRNGLLPGAWASPSATLGLVYAATGVGALLGPLVANSCGGEDSIYTGMSVRRSQLIMVVGFFIGTAAYALLLLGTLLDGDRCVRAWVPATRWIKLPVRAS
jgi:hypothetical protein